MRRKNLGLTILVIVLALLMDVSLALEWATFLGGSAADFANGIALDTSGNIYIAGSTWSTNFPTTTGAYDRTYNGGDTDAFIVKLNPSGSDLIYSTYLGGSLEEAARHIVVDAVGNAYVSGVTRSANFPVTPGAYDTSYNGGVMGGDAFIVKLNALGSNLVYSTYLGGSGDDSVGNIVLDANDNLYLTGTTYSSDFPITPGAYDTAHDGSHDAFVAKLNASGSELVCSTFLGGGAPDSCDSIAIDATGALCVVGQTQSSDFPVTVDAYDSTFNGDSDIFVAKMNSSCSSLLYSTFIGGSHWEYTGDGVLDANGNIYVTGTTDSSDFPVTPGAYDTTFNGFEDVFLAKLNSAGSTLIYATFLGGSNLDFGECIAVDSEGNAYATGQTSDFPTGSGDFPTTLNAYDTTFNGVDDVFVTKLDSSGSILLYSTYLGGSGSDGPHDIITDVSGNVYLVGRTISSNFPTTSGAYDTSYNGDGDAFIAKFRHSAFRTELTTPWPLYF